MYYIQYILPIKNALFVHKMIQYGMSNLIMDTPKPMPYTAPTQRATLSLSVCVTQLHSRLEQTEHCYWVLGIMISSLRLRLGAQILHVATLNVYNNMFNLFTISLN